MTKMTYGMKVVITAFMMLVFLLVCSFFTSFHKIDLIYAIIIIIFLVKYFLGK